MSQTDIVERLMATHKAISEDLGDHAPGEYVEAADEIKRLREELLLWDAWCETLPESVMTNPTPKQGDCTRLNELYLKRTEHRNRVLTQLRERLDEVTKQREEALGYEIKLRAERDQLRLSNERLRESLLVTLVKGMGFYEPPSNGHAPIFAQLAWNNLTENGEDYKTEIHAMLVESQKYERRCVQEGINGIRERLDFYMKCDPEILKPTAESGTEGKNAG